MSEPIDGVGITEEGDASFLYQILAAVSGNIEALTEYQIAQAETVSTLSDHSTLVTKRHGEDLAWWYDHKMKDYTGEGKEGDLQNAQSIYGTIDAQWQGLSTTATSMVSKAESGLEMLSSAISNSTSFIDSLNGIMLNLKNQKVTA